MDAGAAILLQKEERRETIMPEKDKKVTVGLLVVAGLAGLAAALALYGLARAAVTFTCPYCGAEFDTEEELLAHSELVHPGMPPPDGVTQFTYVFPLDWRGLPTNPLERNYLNAADFMTVEVKNIGESAGVCTLTLLTEIDLYASGVDIPKPPWVDKGSISHSIGAGDIIEFGDNQEWVITFPVTGDEWQGYEIRGITLRLVGDAGIYEKYYKHFA